MLKFTQEMRLSQKLDFRMIQSLKLLPLTTLQLTQRISEELELNIMLQVDETVEQTRENSTREEIDTDQKSSAKESENAGDFTEAEWLKYIEDGFDSS